MNPDRPPGATAQSHYRYYHATSTEGLLGILNLGFVLPTCVDTIFWPSQLPGDFPVNGFFAAGHIIADYVQHRDEQHLKKIEPNEPVDLPATPPARTSPTDPLPRTKRRRAPPASGTDSEEEWTDDQITLLTDLKSDTVARPSWRVVAQRLQHSVKSCQNQWNNIKATFSNAKSSTAAPKTVPVRPTGPPLPKISGTVGSLPRRSSTPSGKR
eukprot:Skav210422  [mRNA]  locus=scaffold1573:332141:333578:- [translate_table: standard]